MIFVFIKHLRTNQNLNFSQHKEASSLIILISKIPLIIVPKLTKLVFHFFKNQQPTIYCIQNSLYQNLDSRGSKKMFKRLIKTSPNIDVFILQLCFAREKIQVNMCRLLQPILDIHLMILHADILKIVSECYVCLKVKYGSRIIPFIRQIMVHKIMAQTMGSQFPRVPMVKINGLKSHTITEYMHRSSGTFRSFKMVWINKPTSKSVIGIYSITLDQCQKYKASSAILNIR